MVFNTEIMLIWRLVFEEYGTQIKHNKGLKTQWHTHYKDLKIIVTEILYKSPIILRKLCQKSKALKKYLKLFPLYI